MAPAAVAGSSEFGFAHLVDPNIKWYSNWRIICLNAWITLFLITSSTNGYDGSMMNGLQSLTQWEDSFNHPTGGLLGLLNAIQYIGSIGSLPLAPYITDGLGRRAAIFIGASIMCGATAIQTASQTVNMFIGARFMIGFGVTIAANAAPLLVTEIAYPTYRAQLTALYNSLWYSGAIIAAWSTFGTFKLNNSWAWRVPSLLQGIPSILQVFLIWLAPESPRWLVSKGRDAQALRTLAYYHSDGDEANPLVLFEMEEIRGAIELDRATARNYGWKSLIETKGNRKRLVVIVAIAFFSQWSGNGLVSYYLNKVFDAIGITDPTIQLLINGILQIWNLAIAMGASFLVERVGRRTLFLSSCVGMLLFFTLQTICSSLFAQHGSPGAAHAVIAFIFLYYASYDLAFTPLLVSYSVEILPYNIRAKGFTVMNFVVSVALVFNQYVNPIALDKLGWKYYIVYCCWLVFETVFCFFFIVETKGLSLEETAVLFDGEEMVEKVAATAHDVREDHVYDDKGSDSYPLPEKAA